MFLFFAENKIADEVASIVGTDHAAFLIAYTRHVVRLNLADVLALLPRLIGFAVRRFAVHKPVGGRLYIVVTSEQSVIVHDCRVGDEVRLEECLLAPRILHDEPQTSLIADGVHLDAQGKEPLPIGRPLKYGIRALLCR